MKLQVLNGLIESGRIFILIAGFSLSVFIGTLGKRVKLLKLIIWLGIYIACEYFMAGGGLLSTPLLWIGSFALGSGVGYLLSALVKSSGKKKKNDK